ncbi:NUDIX hydrolase [Halosegnis marinus]|uniref:NUDIX hydrolase n=1 Tax=Halosegnis marinus TaxID=3034023 RepID=A0ABD5ZSC7_9EURY|nr:NUDIX domain-containing protein [Halosegnis sp. DT85]
METTRHFTGTVYVVNDGATALHEHAKLGLTLPPGGHVDRDELPHEAALREAREETGLEPTLLSDHGSGPDAPEGAPVPRPRSRMLYDIDTYDGEVAHQHIDDIYYATVPSRDIDPAPGEPDASAWAWYDRDALAASDLPADVVEFGTAAIEAASKAP